MKNIQQQIKQYLEERNWDKLRPADLAKSIMIEGAELLEHFQWHNYTPEEIEADPELKAGIQQELADVMIYCTELALRLGVDIEEVMAMKLVHNAKKYPADQIRDHSSERARDSYYFKIHQAYRKAGK
jgi:NTP pyrophosphatase (non-canonical NTP hydrolase)